MSWASALHGALDRIAAASSIRLVRSDDVQRVIDHGGTFTDLDERFVGFVYHSQDRAQKAESDLG